MGDVAHFAKNTGFKLKRGKPGSGYVTMLIANERIKFFTVSGVGSTVSDAGNVQQIKGRKRKLTQAGANYVDRALKEKALKRFSQFGTLDVRLIRPASSPGARAAAVAAPAAVAATAVAAAAVAAVAAAATAVAAARPARATRPGGTATVNPGFVDLLPGGGSVTPLIPAAASTSTATAPRTPASPCSRSRASSSTSTPRPARSSSAAASSSTCPAWAPKVELVNPEVVIGATGDASGLFALVNGVRVKVGDLDTDTFDLDIANGTVTVKDLDSTVAGALSEILRPLLGAAPIQAGTPLLELDLSFPEV